MADAEEERGILAGEYALGVLEGEELAAAQRLMLGSREFADMVEWWHYRLNCAAEAAGAYTPSEGVWQAIEKRLRDRDTDETASHGIVPPPARRGYSGWTIGAAMAGGAAAAAAITLFLATPTPVSVPEPSPAPGASVGERLIAQAQSEDGSINLAGIVESGAGRLTLHVAGLNPDPGLAPELWVVPEGGAPHSLGIIPAQGTFARSLSAEDRALIREGSALAITYEDPATAPHAAPGNDILIVGPLAQV